MADSSPARVAGTRVRRLVMRLLVLAGLTGASWLAGMLFAGTASADSGLQININLPGLGTQSTPAKKPAASKSAQSNEGHGLGLGGLVGGLLNTVGNTVQTVTSTVSTVTTAVGHTVGTVVHTVAEIPQKVVAPVAKPLPAVVPVVEETVDTILQPTPTHSGSATTESEATARTEVAPAEVAAAQPSDVAAAQPVVVEHPHLQQNPQRRPATGSVTSPVSTSLEKVAPSDRGPSPLPAPSAPAAPVAPAPSFSSGNDGGSGARGVLATFTPQTRLAPPPLLGRLERGDPIAERGRTPGLPVTTPD